MEIRDALDFMVLAFTRFYIDKPFMISFNTPEDEDWQHEEAQSKFQELIETGSLTLDEHSYIHFVSPVMGVAQFLYLISHGTSCVLSRIDGVRGSKTWVTVAVHLDRRDKIDFCVGFNTTYQKKGFYIAAEELLWEIDTQKDRYYMVLLCLRYYEFPWGICLYIAKMVAQHQYYWQFKYRRRSMVYPKKRQRICAPLE